LISFIAWPDDSEYTEFNIFRYVRKPGMPGLVAYQFAYRFDGHAIDAGPLLRELGGAWLEKFGSVDVPVNFAPLKK